MVKVDPVPAGCPSMVHEIVPVGVPEPGVCTEREAVNTRESPNVAGVSEEVTIKPVLALVTACVPVVEVLR
jgi:hypothetical protein